MAENPTVNTPNSFYQAPLEVPGYVSQSAPVIPKQPIDVYSLFQVVPPKKGKLATRAKTPYELMMEGTDPFSTLMPDIAPIKTNLKTLEPLDDSAGLFHSQDGFGKYGYSSILGGGDNEDRYAQNFRNDNPDLFWQPGFHPWDGIKKGFYWGGGFLEKTLESAVVKTGQGIGAIFGATIGNVANALVGEKYANLDDWLSKSTDNILSSTFNGWDENLKERYHYFQEKSDRENKGFVQSMGDGDFWMNDLSDGLGFLVSSMFEAGLVSKLGLGTKLASRIAPLAEGVSTEAISAGAAGQTSNIARMANAIGLEGSGNMLVKNAVDLTTQTLALTAIESATEAQEVKDKVYQSFEGKTNPETGYLYTEDEKKRLSAAAAGQVFKQNMAILMGPKFLETVVFNRIGQFAKGLFNKSFGEATKEAGKASGAVRSRLGTLASGTTYNKASALSNVWKIGSLAGVGFASEGLFEENIQLAISREAEAAFGGGDEFYRPGTSQKDLNKMKAEDELFGSVGNRYIRQTRQFFNGITDDRYVDDELSKSIGIGGLFGVVGGAVHGSIGIKQQAKVDQYWSNRLDAATTNLFESQNFFQSRIEERADPENPGKTKPVNVPVTDPTTGQPVLDEVKLKQFLNKMNNIQGIMDIIANTEDQTDENNKLPQNKELNKLARNVLFTQLAMEYIKAGKKDMLLSNLSSSSQFSDKDIQALGYEPGMMTNQDKKNMLTKMVSIVERLDKADQWIENNVLDNVSEKRQGKFGLAYTKTQKQKRQEEFQAKKAYLRGLAMQNALLDTYLDDITQSEQGLGEPSIPLLSSVLDENGVPIQDFNIPLHLNARVPALRNQIAILQKQFAYHWENMQSRQRNTPAGQPFEIYSKTANGKTLLYEQMKAEDALEKINQLQEELEPLESQIKSLTNQDAFETFVDEGETYIRPKQTTPTGLEQLEADRIRRVNGVKREEIGIQKGWIEEEWRNTAALKEEKERADRPDTYFSRRMSASKNAYNTYFQREVMERDNSLGQRLLQLYNKDEKLRINAKKYKNNEQKLLKSVRIQGKVQTILAEVNGQKLLAELNALLDRDLPSEEFAEELRKIIDVYNGKPMIIANSDKNLVDDQIDATQEEYNFVASIFEYMPLDDRFNEKYYDIDINGNWVIKPEYDSLPALAQVQLGLTERIDDLTKIKKFLNSIPESIPGDWNNTDAVRKRIADVYTESTDSIINAYNQVSNNGQSEITGDGFNTKQELDKINYEIDELEQLKTIFNDRTKTDSILDTPEFAGYIDSLDKRLEDLEKIKGLVKERLNSRLRENQDFLIDAVNNITEQIGLNFDGTTKNEPLKDLISKAVSSAIFDEFITSLTDLKALMDKEDQTTEDKKAISDSYWSINGQLSAIQTVVKSKYKDEVNTEIEKQKKEQITKLEGTVLMQKLKGEFFYKDLVSTLDDSLLGALQLVFYNTGSNAAFSQIGLGGADINFLDDQPSSPVYKFREDYNLRKLLRNVEKDNSRTPENTSVSKEELIEFLTIAKNIQNLEDLGNNINSDLSLLDQVEKEKQVVQTKIDKKDNKYDNLIVPSIQQLFFIRKIASFLRTKKVTGNPGFKNWIFIQAPGGAGKTQTLGTWFSSISGIPRDRILATAFTEEAARGIKKALLVGEDGPKDAKEMAEYIRELTKTKQLDHDVLIIDEYPAIDVNLQVELFNAVKEYTIAKQKAGKGEFKVITMGDTNQLTFSTDGSISSRPGILGNSQLFTEKGKSPENHPAKMEIIPSLTVNFRSNLFAITSFIDTFKGSNTDHVNEAMKVSSSDPNLNTPDTKGVVSIDKGSFGTKIISYLKLNPTSTRTRAIIVNESKVDQYKKLLTDNGITIIEDPNDEVTKGVYVSTVKNTQGFSFDEVFIDLENKDKLFAGTASPNLVYNKAMYVAASRARNLIVVTNFSNFENIEDSSIAALENKALDELQTKDTDFVAQRDLEIDSAKNLIGSEYNRSVTSVTPTKAEDKVETPLDPDEDETIEEEEQEDEEVEEHIEEIINQEIVPADKVEDEEQVETQVEEGVDETTLPEVVTTNGLEEPLQDENAENYDEGALRKTITQMVNKVKDNTVKAFTKVRDEIVELLFPTGQTIKFKIGDNEFTVKKPDEFENKNLTDGDRVILIPFKQSKTSKSTRNFGYAIITPAIDSEGNVIENSYRTVSVLSDYEIDNLKEKPETINLYNSILENEKRDKGFVSIEYNDVSSRNGFTTSASRIINELQEGKVVHAQPLKYFYGKTYREINASTMDQMIDTFIQNFYENHINSFPEAQRESERKKIKNFYKNSQNAQIIIPINKDIEGKNPNLKIPPDLNIRPGRPYMMFRPFHKASTMQFIPLSRKFLDTKLHNDTLEPIREFINTAKAVKYILFKKGVNSKLGYSRSLSNMLSKLANTYVRNPEESNYSISLISTVNDQKVTQNLTFTNLEAERIYNLYSMYSEPSIFVVESKTEKEIQNLVNVKRARSYTFEDGETIYGNIISYDPATKTFVVRHVGSKEEFTKSGVISHTGKASVGRAQQALDDIFNSNSHIASKFTSVRGRVGFITNKDKTEQTQNEDTEFNKGYKFMAILGSKTAPVAKSYNPDGTTKESYEDVIEILEDLFNFAKAGELPGKNLKYIDNEGIEQGIEVKLRVPISLNARDEAGNVEFNYTNSPENTSRDSAISNSRFFETNFEALTPSRVFVEFEKPQVQEITEVETKPTEIIEPVAKSKEEKIEIERKKELEKVDKAKEGDKLLVDITESVFEQPTKEFVLGRWIFPERRTYKYEEVEGIELTSPFKIWFKGYGAFLFRDQIKKMINSKFDQDLIELENQNVKTLTKEEINSLTFEEIRDRVTPEQIQQIEAYAIKEGFKGADHFFEVLFSSHPEEQVLFRDYLIECLI